MIFLISFDYSKSVTYKNSEGRGDKMKGLDIFAPPSLPRHFGVKKGCRSDIYFGEELESDEDDGDILNRRMLGYGDNS